MKSTLRIWLLFGLALLVVLGVMAWVSWTVLALEDAQAAARAQAELEDAARLALWRMDAALPPLLLQENARPLEAPPRGRDLSVRTADVSTTLIVHFTFDATLYKGPVTAWEHAAGGRLSSEEKLRAFLVPASLAAMLPEVTAQPPRAVDLTQLAQRADPPQQDAGNIANDSRRRDMYARAQISANVMNQQQMAPHPAGPEAAEVQYGVVTPAWMDDDHLVLARRVRSAGRDYVQGSWVNWPALRQSLLDSIRDLLPQADLARAGRGEAEHGERVLASLPVKLLPGPPPRAARTGSPLRFSLSVAWACLLMAAGAVAALLGGALSLSRRRGDFVSSVTHELRTPLTTFRMYTEMLRDGLVDEDRRDEYLQTLHAESNRLTHLVENVLTYSRLDGRGGQRQRDRVRLAQIIDSCRDRLADRCRQANMELVVQFEPGMEDKHVWADPLAAELVLFNLVDNACKYAATAQDRRVHLEVGAMMRMAHVRVRDHGPGIDARDARRLFKAFARVQQEMAGGKQGVGLGLAICRRLATNMGGQLVLQNPGQPGACFVLAMEIG